MNKPKKNHTKKLEENAKWRFIKVIYILLAIIVFVFILDSSVRSISECNADNDPARTTGTSMAQKRLRYNLDQGTQICDSSDVLTEEIATIILSGLTLYLLYLGIRSLSKYIILGTNEAKT
ncbi:hypothetical protein KY385_00445 [Candidatus Parcubacteria bacterium]|nr:hypothetical protein [Candidatus Parcubacteria bacterium]